MLQVATLPLGSTPGPTASTGGSGIRLVPEREGERFCYSSEPVAESPQPADPLRQLAIDASTGDALAVRRLLEAIAPPMLGVVNAVLGRGDRDAEDVLQDALVGVVQSLSSFRAESSFLHFARSIALRRALDQRRKRARRGPEVTLHSDPTPEDADSQPRALAEQLPSTERSPAAAAIAVRRREAFRALLAELRPEQAETFAQRVLFGHSMPEIALLTAAPLDTVKSRLRLAKAALRARIQDDPTLLELSETDDDDA